MITQSQEYYSLLYRIQDPNLFNRAYGEPPTLMPADEPTLKINLNERTIEAPEFLSVKYDHHAETVFFEVDRYYEHIDLAKTTCVVQYENKVTKRPRIYAVPYYDLQTKEGKICFPWSISGEATREAGIVEYSVRFYLMEEIGEEGSGHYNLSYNLNIQPTRSQVLHGMNNPLLEEDYQLSMSFQEEILARLNNLETLYDVYWLEVE